MTKKTDRGSFPQKTGGSDQQKCRKSIVWGNLTKWCNEAGAFSACAFAHFLKYGLELTERAEYEFRAMDMGNIIHQALEEFAVELRQNS